jgi:LmbE family N-acetylglucosaminyl deacetylase
MSSKTLACITASEARHRFETLKLVGLDRLLGDDRVLVIAPHPDDESLGCGGLIAECCAQGRWPVVVVVTDGSGSHPHSRKFPPARLRAVREAETRAAMAILGLPPERLHFLGLADTAAPHEGPGFDKAVADLVAIAAANQCRVVAAPWIHDPHCDHVAAQKMARRVCAVAGLRLLSYPVWGWTMAEDTILPGSPIAGWRLDIAPYLVTKCRAIAAHASQYGGLITDDPSGFRLPPDLLRMFERPFEVFLSDP